MVSSVERACGAGGEGAKASPVRQNESNIQVTPLGRWGQGNSGSATFEARTADVTIPRTSALRQRTRLGTCELVLNGAGLRRKASFKIDVAGLYLTEKRTTPADVLALAGPKRARITLMRNLPAPELAEALKDGVRENSSPEEQQAVRVRVDERAANLAALRHCRRGDVITVDWLPDVGTLVGRTAR